MPLVQRLPEGLEDARALLRRQKKAGERKMKWESLYKEAYFYTMPERETFDEHAPGQRKNRHIYDSTALESTHKAANRMQSMLAPPWRQWAQLAPGSGIPPDVAENPQIVAQLQEQTDILFHHINHSNFSTIVNEAFLDLMIGTCAMTVQPNEDNDGLVFDAVPISQIELEEGPRGSIENVWRPLSVPGAHLERMFPGIELSSKLQRQVDKRPEATVQVIYGVVYDPKSGAFFAVVLEKSPAAIAWRWDYGDAGPFIVARATVVAGEIYGRGPVLWALADIKTLNAMVEFMLRHSALQISPPLTALSDGVLNPYTIRLQPNTVIPVQSNDNSNPSLRSLEVGGNFQIGDVMVNDLRARIARLLLNDDRRAEGPVRTATEVSIENQDLLQQWGAVFGRTQSELLAKVVERSVALLTSMGLMAPLRVDGQQVTVKYVSPLARAQDEQDLLSLDSALQRAAMLGEAILAQGFKVEDIPAWIARKTGMDGDLVRSEAERRTIQQAAAQAAQAEMGGGGNVTPIRNAG